MILLEKPFTVVKKKQLSFFSFTLPAKVESETKVRHKTRRKQFVRPGLSFTSHCPGFSDLSNLAGSIAGAPPENVSLVLQCFCPGSCCISGDFQPSCCTYCCSLPAGTTTSSPSVCVPCPVGFCLLHPVCQAQLSFTAPARPEKLQAVPLKASEGAGLGQERSA